MRFVGGVRGQALHVLERRFDRGVEDGGQVVDPGAALLRVPVEQPDVGKESMDKLQCSL